MSTTKIEFPSPELISWLVAERKRQKEQMDMLKITETDTYIIKK
jgi:hypothetical protein